VTITPAVADAENVAVAVVAPVAGPAVTVPSAITSLASKPVVVTSSTCSVRAPNVAPVAARASADHEGTSKADVPASMATSPALKPKVGVVATDSDDEALPLLAVAWVGAHVSPASLGTRPTTDMMARFALDPPMVAVTDPENASVASLVNRVRRLMPPLLANVPEPPGTVAAWVNPVVEQVGVVSEVSPVATQNRIRSPAAPEGMAAVVVVPSPVSTAP
jgi:hypothetical protein